MFLLRLPVALALLALVAVSLLGAGVTTATRLEVAQIAAVSAEAEAYGQSTTWLQAGLMYAAALSFFIAMVRLLRRTHGFWPWLVGFALYGAAWALAHSIDEWSALIAATPQFGEVTAENAGQIAIQALDQGVLPLAVSLVTGLLILVIDAIDGPIENDDRP